VRDNIDAGGDAREVNTGLKDRVVVADDGYFRYEGVCRGELHGDFVDKGMERWVMGSSKFIKREHVGADFSGVIATE